MTGHRLTLKKYKRIVLKIGSSVIASRGEGLNEARLQSIAGEIAALRAQGQAVFLVSSGAILCGTRKLGLSHPPRSIQMKQATAAVGQSQLMWAYEKCFERFGIKVAQILLTNDCITDRRRFINARNTLMALLDRKILPVINENDTVTVEEIKLGDNDHLAAQVTHLVDASLLVALSDVDGLYTADPRETPSAKRLSVVEKVSAEIEAISGGSGKLGGTGGMASKVKMAKDAAAFGVTTLILNGTIPGLLHRAFEGEDLGTLFLPQPTRLSSKKHWIAYALRPKGELLLDQGAAVALLKKGRSLLPSGISGLKGCFDVGDLLRCLSPEGKEIAKGLTNYSASEIMRIKGRQSAELPGILGYKGADEVIHRDNLVIQK